MDFPVMEFDAERFIHEVKIRPALWQLSSEEYSDKFARSRCWDELVSMFGGVDLSTVPERQRREMTRTLRRKWKSFRDCFARENHRLKQAITFGDLGLRKTQYIYYKQLLFLKQNEQETEEEPKSDPIENFEDKEEKVVPRRRPRNKNKFLDKKPVPIQPSKRKIDQPTNTVPADLFFQTDLNPLDVRFEQIDVFPVLEGQPVPPENDIPLDDSDKLFLLSLVEPLKSIPEHMRFGIKIELMRVIQNAQAQASSQCSSNNDILERSEDSYQVESEYSCDRKSPFLLDQKHLEPEMEIMEFP